LFSFVTDQIFFSKKDSSLNPQTIGAGHGIQEAITEILALNNENIEVMTHTPRLGLGLTDLKSHHQKCVIIDNSIAYLGGIDLAMGRYEDGSYAVSPATLWPDWYNPMYAHDKQHPRQPWRDIQCKITGKELLTQILENFHQRWAWGLGVDVSEHTEGCDAVDPVDGTGSSINGSSSQTKWRGLICRSFQMSPHEPVDRSILFAMLQGIRSARNYIYIENQFFISANSDFATLWNPVARYIIERLNQVSDLSLFIILPMLPETSSLRRLEVRALFSFQHSTLKSIRDQVKPKQLGVFCVASADKAEPHIRNMVHVHSNIMLVDDTLLIIGSANINDGSLEGTRDTEIALAATHETEVLAFRKKIVASLLPPSTPFLDGPLSLDMWKQCAAANMQLWIKKDALNGFLLPHPSCCHYPIPEIDGVKKALCHALHRIFA
jgi:phospholipase D1/2